MGKRIGIGGTVLRTPHWVPANRVRVLFPDEYAYGDDDASDPSHLLHRNGAVVDCADEIHAVWDGNSHGTHAITLAKHKGVPVHVHNVLQADWQRFS